MKPIYLEFCGINSFSERAEIDFVKLTQYGIFGIFGDTGSGKSTILDCIAFAVYGDVGRARSGSIADIINYKSDRANVLFEFEIVYGGSRRSFRIERELKRKNAVQSARVYERKGEVLSALAEGVRDSNALLKEIVGLEQRDFEKCIALPQGEFAQFVKSQRSDRLKLISRLFDLEAYGERLVKKANGRYAELENERAVCMAKLEPYQDVSAKAIADLEEELTQSTRQEEKEKTALVQARAELERLKLLSEKRREFEKVSARLFELEGKKAEMDALSADLLRLEQAETYVKAETESVLAQKARDGAYLAMQRAAREQSAAEEREQAIEKELRVLREQDCTEELTAQLTRAQEYERTAAQLAKKESDLAKTRNEYRQEAENFREFSYEDRREALEKQQAALGEGDMLSFANEQGKSALFCEEYGLFVSELKRLTEKYPEIAGDSAALIEKYSLLAGGESRSFEEFKARYVARVRERNTVAKALLDLEKENGLYRAHKQRLSTLQTQGVELKKEVEELKKALPQGELPAIAALRKRLEGYKEEIRRKTQEKDAASVAFKEKTGIYTSLQAEFSKAEGESVSRSKFAEQMKGAGKFSSIEEAKLLVTRYGNAEHARARAEEFYSDYKATVRQKEELSRLQLEGASEEAVSRAQTACDELEISHTELVRKIAVQNGALTRQREMLERKKGLEEELRKVGRDADIFERLKSLLAGNKFIEFVAEEYLQNVAEGASGRLLSLTDGRYFLRYQEGGFFVGDNFNGGALRGVYTLSGGETFLVSLSLALSLSAEICAKSLRPIEFFFLDEGFGTLDERLVDTVMDSLERLKNEHFSIGIISHVEELKHRIGSKLSVERASESHGSQIRTE